MTNRSSGKVEIRLSARGGEAVRKELIALGPAGEKVAKRLERATKAQAAPGLNLLDRSAREARSSLSGLESRAGPAGRVLGALGPAGNAAAIGIGAIVIAGTAALRMAREAVREFDAMAKAADDLALHTDTFQTLRFQAVKASVGFSQVEASMRQFVRASAEAAQGRGELSEKLRRSHPEVLRDIQLQTTTEGKLQAVARALKNARDEQERTLIATAAFGESGRSMIRVLGGGEKALSGLTAEARAMGFVIEEDVLRRSEALNTQLDLIAAKVKLDVNRAFVDLGPVIVTLGGFVQDLTSDFRTLLQMLQKVENVGAPELVRRRSAVFEDISRFRSQRHSLLKTLNADIAGTDLASDIQPGEFVKSDGSTGSNIYLANLDKLISDLETKKTKILDRQKEIDDATSRRANPAISEDPGGISSVDPARRAELERLVEQATSRSQSEAEKLTATLKALDEARANGLITSDKELERLKQSEIALSKKTEARRAAAQAARDQAEADQLVARIIAESQTPTDAYIAALEKLEAVKHRLSDDQFAAEEARLAKIRDAGNAALAEEARLKQLAADLSQRLTSVTLNALDPQEQFNEKLRELRQLEPHLTVDEYKKRLQELEAELASATAAQDAFNKRQRDIEAVRASILTPQERRQNEINDLGKLRSVSKGDGGLTSGEYDRALQQINKRYDQVNAQADQHLQLIDSITRGILGQEGAWDQMIETAIQGLIRLAVQMATTNQAANSGGGGGGFFDQLIGAVLGSPSGGGSGAGSIFGGGSGSGSGGASPVVPAKPSAPTTQRVATPIPISPGAKSANFGSAGAAPLKLVVNNYGAPAEVETKESIGPDGIRQLEIKMFEIGRRASLQSLQDGTADRALSGRYGLAARPGGR